MRVDTEQRTFETDITATPSTFQIKASAKAFQILSNALYTNKALAIVRELVANAIDAHVAAGTVHLPFRVHFPTSLEPWFEIEDFGTGLSDAAIYTLYCTYFASDKTESDELIGGFGLGSKSPFAYTDQFTVTSRYQGEKRTYAIHIGAEGTPQIMCTVHEATDEHDGLTVSVGVALSDAWDFVMVGGHVMPYLSCLYTTNIDVNKPTYSMQTEIPGTGARLCVRQSGSSDIHVIQGCVRYATSTMNCPELSDWPRAIDLYVPIGTLDVAVNRESIAYSERTRAWFKEAGTKVHQLLKQQVLDQLGGYATVAGRTRFLLGLTRSNATRNFVTDDMFDIVDPPAELKMCIVDTMRGRSRKSRTKVEIRLLLPDPSHARAFTKFIVEQASNNMYWSEKERWVKPYAVGMHNGPNCPSKGITGLAIVGSRDIAVDFIESLGMMEAEIIDIWKPLRKPRNPGAPRVSQAGKYHYYRTDGLDCVDRKPLSTILTECPGDQVYLVGELFDGDIFRYSVRPVLDVLYRFKFDLPEACLIDIPFRHNKVREHLVEHEEALIGTISKSGSNAAIKDTVELLGLDKDDLRDLIVREKTRAYTVGRIEKYTSYPYDYGKDLLKKLAISMPDLGLLLTDIRIMVKDYSDKVRNSEQLNRLAQAIFEKDELAEIEKESDVNLFAARIEAVCLTHGPWVKHLMKLATQEYGGNDVEPLVAQILSLQRQLNDKESECTPISLLNVA